MIIPGRKGLIHKNRPRKGGYGVVLYQDVRSKSIGTDPKKDVMGLCYTRT